VRSENRGRAENDRDKKIQAVMVMIADGIGVSVRARRDAVTQVPRAKYP